MKKLIVAIAAMGALAGCQKKPADEVRERRADLAQEQRDLAKTEQEKSQDVAETRAEANEDFAETRQDVNEDLAQKQANEQERLNNAAENRDEKVAEAQKNANEDIQDQREDVAEKQRALNEAEAKAGYGGSGALAVSTVVGTVEKTTDDTLTLKEADGKSHKLNVDDNTRFVFGDQTLKLRDLHDGARVRASYKMVDDKPIATRVDVARQ